MSEIPIIAADVRRHYAERMDRAQTQQAEIDRLLFRADGRLAAGEHIAETDVARFLRAHGGQNLLGPERPGEHGHWSTSYLHAMDEADYGSVNRALEDIAFQTADRDGRHRPADAALFTAAVELLVPVAFTHCSEPDLIDDITEGLSMVFLADGLARTGIAVADPAWHPFLARAARLATTEANAEAHALRRPSSRNNHDDLGRHVYLVSPLDTIRRAQRIARIARQQGALADDDPALARFCQQFQENEPLLEDETVRLCAFGLIHTSLNYHLAEPAKLNAEQIRALSEIAWRLHDRHSALLEEGGRQPDPLKMPAMPTGRALDATAQSELVEELDRFSRTYNSWFDCTRNFDDYGRPGADEFRRLDVLHSEQMVRYARIILSAAQIADAEHADRRDAVILSAAGAVNWETREEFDMYVRHRGPAKAAAEGALERIDTATAVIAAMPDSVLSPRQRETALLHDRNRRHAMVVLSGGDALPAGDATPSGEQRQ